MKSCLSLLLAVLLPIGAAIASPPDDADKVIEHLEFLGYTTERSDERLLARHEKHLNVSLKQFQGGILFTAWYIRKADVEKADNRTGFLELVNRLNRDAAAVRYYIDDDGDLVIEGWYPGAYRKDVFGLFVENFNHAMTQVSENIDEVLRYVD